MCIISYLNNKNLYMENNKKQNKIKEPEMS